MYFINKIKSILDDPSVSKNMLSEMKKQENTILEEQKTPIAKKNILEHSMLKAPAAQNTRTKRVISDETFNNVLSLSAGKKRQKKKKQDKTTKKNEKKLKQQQKIDELRNIEKFEDIKTNSKKGEKRKKAKPDNISLMWDNFDGNFYN